MQWQIPGWHRWLFVADDGRHAVTGCAGLNLIPKDYSESLVLFTFWHQGTKVREITLKEFIPSKAVLQETASHFHWGFIEGIDAQGRLVVKRADEKRFRYDLASGKLVQ